MITTLLEVLACVLLAAGLGIITAALIGGLLGVGVGTLVAAIPFVGLSYLAERE